MSLWRIIFLVMESVLILWGEREVSIADFAELSNGWGRNLSCHCQLVLKLKLKIAVSLLLTLAGFFSWWMAPYAALVDCIRSMSVKAVAFTASVSLGLVFQLGAPRLVAPALQTLLSWVMVEAEFWAAIANCSWNLNWKLLCHYWLPLLNSSVGEWLLKQPWWTVSGQCHWKLWPLLHLSV